MDDRTLLMENRINLDDENEDEEDDDDEQDGPNVNFNRLVADAKLRGREKREYIVMQLNRLYG